MTGLHRCSECGEPAVHVVADIRQRTTDQISNLLIRPPVHVNQHNGSALPERQLGQDHVNRVVGLHGRDARLGREQDRTPPSTVPTRTTRRYPVQVADWIVEIPNSVPVLPGIGDHICAEIVRCLDAVVRNQRRAQPECGLFREDHELLTAIWDHLRMLHTLQRQRLRESFHRSSHRQAACSMTVVGVRLVRTQRCAPGHHLHPSKEVCLIG